MKLSLTDRINVALAVPLSLLALVDRRRAARRAAEQASVPTYPPRGW